MEIADYKQAVEFLHKPLNLNEGKTCVVAFGKLHIFVKKYMNEYHLEWRLERNAKPGSRQEPDSVTKTIKLVLKNETDSIKFLPALPDMPLVLKSNQSMKISSGIKCRFYILIPVFLRVVRVKSENSILMESPATPVFKSWFGDMDQGELGYHQLSSFYQEINNVSSKYFQVICPLIIHNRSKSDLVFDKLLIQCKYLSIFQGVNNFWTNEILVNYDDDSTQSIIQISPKAPSDEKKLNIIMPASESFNDNLVFNAFEKIKKLAGV